MRIRGALTAGVLSTILVLASPTTPALAARSETRTYGPAVVLSLANCGSPLPVPNLAAGCFDVTDADETVQITVDDDASDVVHGTLTLYMLADGQRITDEDPKRLVPAGRVEFCGVSSAIAIPDGMVQATVTLRTPDQELSQDAARAALGAAGWPTQAELCADAVGATSGTITATFN